MVVVVGGGALANFPLGYYWPPPPPPPYPPAQPPPPCTYPPNPRPHPAVVAGGSMRIPQFALWPHTHPSLAPMRHPGMGQEYGKTGGGGG